MTKIPHAKLLFVIVSKVFVGNYWPAICKLDNFTSAIYEEKSYISYTYVKMKSRKHGFGLLPIRNSVGKIELILRTTDYKPTGYTVVQVLYLSV
jgi:hypothetical protein